MFERVRTMIERIRNPLVLLIAPKSAGSSFHPGDGICVQRTVMTTKNDSGQTEEVRRPPAMKVPA
ncbi:hypothetical protein DWV92_04570 [Bifidobacterium pseudolongum]|uniref:Uncharacterized protein n=1 Tax=Bifidobacterium pseudolongum TaxID=1694 RepID=A0A395XGW1_9BIFI|nr:hypothetical protein DWV92_04570 [Bifidobacterium pseudolongum]